MHYGQNNSIGPFLTIAMGVCAFGAWLYTCYPATAGTLANDSRQSWSFLVLGGFVIVALFGVSIARSVLHGVMMLLRSLVQLSLVIAIVIGGVMLWQREPTQPPTTVYQLPTDQRPIDRRPEDQSPLVQPTTQAPPIPPTPSTNARWWE